MPKSFIRVHDNIVRLIRSRFSLTNYSLFRNAFKMANDVQRTSGTFNVSTMLSSVFHFCQITFVRLVSVGLLKVFCTHHTRTVRVHKCPPTSLGRSNAGVATCCCSQYTVNPTERVYRANTVENSGHLLRCHNAW